ncbi:MAG: NAD(+)/NADH kinase [Bacteroidales bacterium]|nr:NAD(+)/NADH kinase [Bacteroidales bacterium]
MMTIGIYTRRQGDADTRQSIQQLTDIMRQRGIRPLQVNDCLPDEPLDFLLTVGGDGTLLNSLNIIGATDIPVVGINFGHLGFLTTAGRNDMEALIDSLVKGHYTIEQRTLLDIEVGGQHMTALNEAVLHRDIESEMLRTKVYVNDECVGTYAGNGVIVATPTGSTAYSLSCGGPILTPDCGCFVVTPIAAHTLTLRPVIVPDSATLRLATDPEHAKIHLSLDSRQEEIVGGQDILLKRAAFTIRLTRMNNQTFFTAIRQKLMWGV